MERHGKHVTILVLSSLPPTTSAVRFSSALLTCGLLNLSLRLGWKHTMGADMPPRTAFATLLVAFAIASVCAGLTTARQLHEQASNARIISRG